ncbi:MAG: ABC transporter permease, partial [Bdellovibrionota bacterium]
VLSVMDGFEAELKKRLISSDLHILVTPPHELQGFEKGYVPESSVDPVVVKQTLGATNEVISFSPVVSTEAILKSGRKVTGVVLKGVDEPRLKKIESQMVDSIQLGNDSVGIIVGNELALEMGLVPGDKLLLISPTEKEGPLQSVPRMKQFHVSGIYKSGLPEQELHTVFASSSLVRSFLRKSGVVSQWEIAVKDFGRAAKGADDLRRVLPGFKVQDWNQLNAHLFASLRLERIAMFVILAFIVVVASFNIVTTLTLMVLEKKKEIAILKAMGARRSEVAAIFLSEGMLIGGIGVAAGAVVGFCICMILRKYEFIKLPDVFYDRTLPVTFDPAYYFAVAGCAFLIVAVACIYPSWRAARLNPLDGIRFG